MTARTRRRLTRLRNRAPDALTFLCLAFAVGHFGSVALNAMGWTP